MATWTTREVVGMWIAGFLVGLGTALLLTAKGC